MSVGADEDEFARGGGVGAAGVTVGVGEVVADGHAVDCGVGLLGAGGLGLDGDAGALGRAAQARR